MPCLARHGVGVSVLEERRGEEEVSTLYLVVDRDVGSMGLPFDLTAGRSSALQRTRWYST